MKRILVTGGAGYIGSHTVVCLQESGYEVVVVDNLSNSNREVMDGIAAITGVRPALEVVDCLDKAALEAVMKKYAPIDAVIHFAASKAVGESVEKPLMYYRNNIGSLLNVLDLIIVTRYLHGNRTLSDVEMRIADVSQDGVVDVFDLGLLKQAAVAGDCERFAQADLDADDEITATDVVILTKFLHGLSKSFPAAESK